MNGAETLLRAAWWGLLALQPAWHALLPAPWGSQSWTLAGFAAAPLLALTSGVVQDRGRSRQWAIFLVMLYFIVGVVETWSNPSQRVTAALQVLLCVMFFVTLVRVSRQHRRARA